MDKENHKEVSHPWYKEGLHFKCQGCGQCCTGCPGYVWVNERGIAKIAKFLNISIEEFSKNYLRLVKGYYSLKELPETYSCIFLKGKKCSIYPVRPVQCSTFPWWPHNLKNEEEWRNNVVLRCKEGTKEGAPLVPFKEIQKNLSLYTCAYLIEDENKG